MERTDGVWNREHVLMQTVRDAERFLMQRPGMRSVDVGTSHTAFEFEHTLTGCRILALQSLRSTGTIAGVYDSGDEVVVVWLKSGLGTLRDHPVPIGRPTLYRREPDPFRWDGFEKDVLHISRRVVEEVAAERGGWEIGPLEFDPLWVPQGAPLAAWWVMVQQVADAILAGPSQVTPARQQQLARIAAGGLLFAIPHWPVGQTQASPAQSRLARAEEYLLEHARERVSVPDVAAAVGLSVRGLQQAFRREHSISPLVFLRRVRLGMAREELLEGGDITVADVAAHSGFTHLGRFASAYQSAFGELPSDTLRGSAGAQERL
ncbi:AraC family transcriptional regulator [Curtobacterium ammoniigenes]|uniref:AraC family transcriptional regulator n=1 Tax=Curtobacterium ammoniigenes TaxID=395387 RepID=UPI0008307CBF|nr:helix-turn-helix domain-containing protein [Curtobacterium ammoniigenes]